ncbi:c-type cytochrome [Cupriavidus sp. 2SB]|uniref:c-type cytochrome n=1 Tax=Cupriavidus sp. 2SB TaxID=2502199 RepID=UPI0010F803EC|nr:c-type cytochrome [Cupriavidus sp. 2SB]
MNLQKLLSGAFMSMAASMLLSLVPASTHAQDAAALAQKNNCMACHAVDKKLVGPAFKDVAARYKAKPNAEVTVAKSIRQGSSGNWGGMPMPPNAGVNEEQAAQLAKWVLSR